MRKWSVEEKIKFFMFSQQERKRKTSKKRREYYVHRREGFCGEIIDCSKIGEINHSYFSLVKEWLKNHPLLCTHIFTGAWQKEKEIHVLNN